MKHFQLYLFLLLFSMGSTVCRAQSLGSIIRDTEIEEALSLYLKPLAVSAGLNPTTIHAYVLGDDTYNAFTAGGLTLIVHTGLIKECTHVGQFVGVLAHELGHIAKGHVAMGMDHMGTMSRAALMGQILGAVASVATLNPAPMLAVGGASQIGAMGHFMRYRRSQEVEADIAALKYLDVNKVSPEGMHETFKALVAKERFQGVTRNPYLSSHPDVLSRSQRVEQAVSQSGLRGKAPPQGWTESYNRIRAKLVGYTMPLQKTFERYPSSDTSIDALYARSIAYAQLGDLAGSLPLLDTLIRKEPQNPYFYEAKGDALYRAAKAQEALQCFQKAVELKRSPLLLTQLAQVELALGPTYLDQARKHVEEVLNADREDPLAWHLFAMVQGRLGKAGLAAYGLAEKALLQGNIKETLHNVARAEKTIHLENCPAECRRLKDLKVEAERLKDKKRHSFDSDEFVHSH